MGPQALVVVWIVSPWRLTRALTTVAQSATGTLREKEGNGQLTDCDNSDGNSRVEIAGSGTMRSSVELSRVSPAAGPGIDVESGRDTPYRACNIHDQELMKTVGIDRMIAQERSRTRQWRRGTREASCDAHGR